MHSTYTIIKDLEKKDLHNLIYWIIPLFIGVTILCIIEDKIIPEEFSNRKILDRIIQVIGVLFFIMFNLSIKEKFNINADHTRLLVYSAFSWLGYIVSSLGSQFYYNFSLPQV